MRCHVEVAYRNKVDTQTRKESCKRVGSPVDLQEDVIGLCE